MGVPDLEAASESGNFAVKHIGYLKGEMRIILRNIDSGKPAYVIELHEIYAYFNLGVIDGQAIIVSCRAEPGTFGWRMSPKERSAHKELFLISKADVTNNPFRAMARRVVFGRFNEAEDLNFPA